MTDYDQAVIEAINKALSYPTGSKAGQAAWTAAKTALEAGGMALVPLVTADQRKFIEELASSWATVDMLCPRCGRKYGEHVLSGKDPCGALAGQEMEGKLDD